MKRLYLLLLSLLPLFALAQSEPIPDRVVQAGCEEELFSQVEILPAIQGGETALSDSLSAYLKRRQVVIKPGKALFGLLITTQSQIFEISQLSGNRPAPTVFSEALRAYSHMWIPARQNSHKVCVRIRLKVAFGADKITLKVMQGRP